MAGKELAAQNTLGGLEAFNNFASVNAQIQGLEVVDASDIKMPKIKLLQPMSDEVTTNKGRAGQFYNTLTEEAMDTLECSFLMLGKSRIKWRKPFKRGEDPECRSFDGEYSEDGVSCKTCPDCKWGNNKERPDCGMSYTWLGAIPTASGDYQAFRMIAAGTSFGPTRDFIGKVMNILRIGGRTYPLYILKVKVTSSLEKGESGSYYVMKYELAVSGKDSTGRDIYDMIPIESAPAFDNMLMNLKDLFAEVNRKDVVTASGSEDVVPETGAGALF